MIASTLVNFLLKKEIVPVKEKRKQKIDSMLLFKRPNSLNNHKQSHDSVIKILHQIFNYFAAIRTISKTRIFQTYNFTYM